MKLLIDITLIYIFITSYCYCQNTSDISIGHIDKVKSTVFGGERKIWIYNPADYSPGNKERFPVLYLLDPEEHFISTAAMVKQMAGRWPAMIVVGVTNVNRMEELTPVAAGGNEVSTQGKFMTFIEKELIPYIDSTYPTAPYRIISGHSLGGLTVIHTLLNNSSAFNAYIAIDPSLWWNDQALVRQAHNDFNTKRFDNISLFVGRAKNMPPNMDTVKAMQDKTEYTVLYRSVKQFVDELSASGLRGLCWTSTFYPEEIHGTVQLNGQYDALKFLFNYYHFRTSMFELYPKMDIDSAVEAHFKNVSGHLGYVVRPSQQLINNLGYTCMGLHKMQQAEKFFKQNIDNYPQEANCFDSMGDYYVSVGNNEKAILNYKKALTLGDSEDTRTKLNNLLKSR